MFDALTSIDAAKVMKIEDFFAFLCVVTLCAGVLYLVYRRITPRETDEREFAATIFILTIAIGLLVSIIKSAPAISFGLFGAMSIVRFRAQIKRPQRMIFIFMAAAIGVCCGAGQYLMTVLGTGVLSALTLASFAFVPVKVKKQKDGAATASGATKDATGSVLEAQASKGPIWGVDFVPATMVDGERFRVLIVVDEAGHEVLAAVPETSFSGARVAGELDRLIVDRGRPASIISEGWPQLASPVMHDWQRALGIEWRWLETVKECEPFVPAAATEARERCLSGLDYANLIQARVALEAWRLDHNQRIAAEASLRAERSSTVQRLNVKTQREQSSALGADAMSAAAAILAPTPVASVLVAREHVETPPSAVALDTFQARGKASTGH